MSVNQSGRLSTCECRWRSDGSRPAYTRRRREKGSIHACVMECLVHWGASRAYRAGRAGHSTPPSPTPARHHWYDHRRRRRTTRASYQVDRPSGEDVPVRSRVRQPEDAEFDRRLRSRRWGAPGTTRYSSASSPGVCLRMHEARRAHAAVSSAAAVRWVSARGGLVARVHPL